MYICASLKIHLENVRSKLSSYVYVKSEYIINIIIHNLSLLAQVVLYSKEN